MRAQASVQYNPLTLQTQEADLQAVFIHLQTVSSANPFGAASLVIRRGFRQPSSPFYHPFPIASKSVLGNSHVQLEIVRGRRQSIVFLFSLTEHPIPRKHKSILREGFSGCLCILTTELHRINGLTMSIPYIICCCTSS